MKLYKVRDTRPRKRCVNSKFRYFMSLTLEEGQKLEELGTEFEIAHITKQFVYLRPKKSIAS